MTKLTLKSVIVIFIYKHVILISSLSNYMVQILSSEDKSSLNNSGIIFSFSLNPYSSHKNILLSPVLTWPEWIQSKCSKTSSLGTIFLLRLHVKLSFQWNSLFGSFDQNSSFTRHLVHSGCTSHKSQLHCSHHNNNIW